MGLAWNGLEVELRGEADTAGDGVVLSCWAAFLYGSTKDYNDAQ